MGSLSIRNMNQVVGMRDLQQGTALHIADMTATMDAYKAKFGSAALRELYMAKGRDWKETLEACEDILAGKKHGMMVGGALALMNTSVAQNGGK